MSPHRMSRNEKEELLLGLRGDGKIYATTGAELSLAKHMTAEGLLKQSSERPFRHVFKITAKGLAAAWQVNTELR